MKGAYFRKFYVCAVIAALAVQSGCQQGVEMPVAAESDSCSEPSFDAELNGLSYDAAVKRLGPALRDDIFPLSMDGMTEFRIEILNYYELPKEAGRPIREVQWRVKECNLAIWFADDGEGWVSFDNVRWDDNTEF
jgi:hypothetical protein